VGGGVFWGGFFFFLEAGCLGGLGLLFGGTEAPGYII